MTQFTYTNEEQEHLQEQIICIYEEQNTAMYDAEYYRDEAQLLRNRPVYSSHYYPHPDDVDVTTPEDLENFADSIECQMYRDDWL